MMLTPCWPRAGPTGGAGVAAPALICSLMKPAIRFFLGGMLWSLSLWAYAVGDDPVAVPRGVPSGWTSLSSDLGDLGEGQLDRGLPAEDGDEHLELLGVGVDLRDGGGEGLEGGLHDRDR